jgi:hypothetical protein
VNRRTGRHDARPAIRWWPAILVLAVGTGLLAYIWLRPAASLQDRVVPSFPVLFGIVVALLLWLVRFSRLPARRRRRIFLGTALVVGAGFLLLEIEGVDGNLVPLVGWRWAGEPDYGAGGTPGAVATAPGSDARTLAPPGRRGVVVVRGRR